MDEKKRILRVLEKTEQMVDQTVEEQVKHSSEHGISHPNQTNPIYKKLMNFKNAKIGDKWSIRDLLR